MKSKKYTIDELGALLYVASVSIMASTGDTIVQVSRIVLVFTFVIQTMKRRRLPIKQCKELIAWELAFMVFCGLSTLWAVNKWMARGTVSTILYISITDIILAMLVIRKPAFLFDIIKAIIWGGVIHGIRVYAFNGLFVYLTSRGGGSVESGTIMGFVCPIAVILSFIILSFKQTRNPLQYKILLSLNMLFSVLTFSRKSYTYLLVFFALYYILRSTNLVRTLKRVLFAACLITVILIAIYKIPSLYNLIGNRFYSMILGLRGGTTDSSTGFRLHLIQWGLEWFKANPILGYGIGCYKYMLGSTYNTWVGTAGIYAHNNYIELLVDIGFLGTVIYYYLYYRIIKKTVRMRKNRSSDLVLLSSFSLTVSLLVNEIGQVSYSIAFLRLVLIVSWLLSLRNINNVTREKVNHVKNG